MISTLFWMALLAAAAGLWLLGSSAPTPTAAAAATHPDRNMQTTSAANSQSSSSGGRPSGARAIAAHAGVTDPHAPAFGEAEVRSYFSHNSAWRNMASASTTTITRIAFMTSHEASQLLANESTGLADDTLVCFVQLAGTFVFPAPDGTVTYQKGYELFDAHTGNLLMAGGLA